MTDTTNNENPILNLSLGVEEVNTILSALQELPYKVADRLIKSIISQAQTQLGQE